MNTVGKRIKTIRLQLELTQSELAMKLGTTQSFLSAVEKDKNPLSESMINALELNFGVNKDWVLYGKGEPYKDEYLNRQLETKGTSKFDNLGLLEHIIINIEQYLIDNNKKITPKQKAKLQIYFYQHFSKDSISDIKTIKTTIDGSIDVLYTILED